MRTPTLLILLGLLAVPSPVTAQDSPSNFFETSPLGALSVKKGDTPQALSIERTSIKVEVVGRMARTEVTQVFRSHLGRQSEGEYRFTLPDGAAVSRLAMDVEGKMMEGELHERKRAREIYEGIVRRMKDPALLEWEGGNRFRTRIFPIPPRGTKTVILTYEQLLDGTDARYIYALPKLVGADHDVALGSFEFRLEAWETGRLEMVSYQDAKVTTASGRHQVRFVRKQFVPDGPVIVSLPRLQDASQVLTAKVDGERFFLLDHTPNLPAATLEPRPIVFAVDTSASVGDAQLSRVRKLIRQLAAAHPAEHSVVYGDLDTVTCSTGDGGSCLDHVKAGGGSDLAKLIREARQRAGAFGKPATVLLFTDGTPTLGILDAQGLAARAATSEDIVFHGVAVGNDADEGLLGTIAQAGGGRSLRLLPQVPLAQTAAAVATMVRTPVLRDVRVSVASGKVEGLVPHLPLNLGAGEPLAVLGRLEGGAAELLVEGTYGGKKIQKRLQVAAQGRRNHPVVRNFWARGVLETMEVVGVEPDRIVQTSLHYGVMSRFTSFLVLENEAAYRQHGVERRKVNRSESSLSNLVGPGAARPEELGNLLGNQEAFDAKLNSSMSGGGDSLVVPRGSGGMGLRGTRVGGGGEGYGRIHGLGKIDTGGGRGVSAARGRKVKRVPKVRVGSPVVMGSLDRNVIQRVIRRRLNGVRYCYQRELQRDPYLQGKVVVHFVVNERGRVAAASIKSSTLDSPAAENCIVRQMKRLRFPEPMGGGIMRISYPFVFTGGAQQEGRYLQANRDTLDPSGRSELIAWWLTEGKRKRALHYLRSSLKKMKTPSERAQLFVRPSVRAAFPAAFAAAAETAIQQPDPPSWLVTSVVAQLAPKGAKAVLDRFGNLDKLGPGAGNAVLMALVAGGDEATARRLAAKWQSRWEPDALHVALSGLAESLPETTLAVTGDILAQRFDATALRNHFRAAGVIGPERASVAVARHCGVPPKGMLADCRKMLDQVGNAEHVVAAREQLLGEVEKNLRTQRKHDFDNAHLIRELALVLRQRRRHEAAARLLSELVEFSGTNPARRAEYGRALGEAGDAKGACRELGMVTQLDPNQREAFKSMMALHRDKQLSAKAADACIVEGVASLPAKAEVVAVLTWEDPSVDVDLRITEPGGDVVAYDRTRSDAGGLLYYDVRKGLGPEIYASPAVAPGKYAFNVVYYGGAAKNVPARLTLIEHPGTRREKRTVRSIVLPEVRSAHQMVITVK